MNRLVYTLLLIDDFEPDLELYRRSFGADANCTYRLLEAETATAGLEFCRDQRVDAILLDYVLPDADGLEFLEALHRQSNGSSPPVVMVTGEGNEQVAVQALKLGAEDYLVKRKLTPELLRVSIRTAIENTQLRVQLAQSDDPCGICEAARFRISVENMLDCFGIYSAIRDASGQIVDFRIDYLNAAAFKDTRLSHTDVGARMCEKFPAHRETGLLEDYCRVVEMGQPLVKEELIYSDTFGTQYLTRAYDIHASKLGDGLVISWRDVTQRKQLELELNQKVEDLQQQQYFLQRLIDTAPIGIGIGAADGEVKVINDTMLDLHGYSREAFEQQGMNWRDFTPPEYAEQTKQAMAVLQQQGSLPAEEKELLRPDGSRVPIWVSATRCMTDQDDHVAFAIDISERKQTEAKIQQLNQELSDRLAELESIYATAPVGLCFVDQDLRYVRINDRLAEINGVPIEPHMGRTVCEVLPELADQIGPLFQQVLETGEPLLDVNVRGATKAQPGVERDWLASYYPLKTADEKVLGVNVMVQEITDRIQAEERLQESEERLRLGVHVAGIALAKIDYASNTVVLSPEAAALYGLSELVISRDRIHATFHPDEQDMMQHIIQQVVNPNGEGWFELEHRVVWQTGEVRWLNVRKQVFFEPTEDGLRAGYAILAAIDISDRKLAEAERERLLAEAEAANRSKDEFVAMVAHELRSPLNSIQGWAKLLQKRKVNEEILTKALETIVRNTETQVQLVEDLLDISRLVRGQIQLNLAPVNLAQVIESAIDIVQLQAHAKQIKIDTRLELPPQILGDFNRLQQIVVNLLNNAIKFTQPQGQVMLALMSIGPQVQLVVRDTGKGIEPEFLPRIFERFQQGQKNTGGKDGLGLGLAIVKNLVELHGGTIHAASAGIDQGATFTIQLPILKPLLED